MSSAGSSHRSAASRSSHRSTASRSSHRVSIHRGTCLSSTRIATHRPSCRRRRRRCHRRLSSFPKQLTEQRCSNCSAGSFCNIFCRVRIPGSIFLGRLILGILLLRRLIPGTFFFYRCSAMGGRRLCHLPVWSHNIRNMPFIPSFPENFT